MKYHSLYPAFKKARRLQIYTALALIVPTMLVYLFNQELLVLYTQYGVYYFLVIIILTVGVNYYKMRHFTCPSCLHNKLAMQQRKLIDGANLHAKCSNCQSEMVTDVISKRVRTQKGHTWKYIEDKDFEEKE